MWRRRGGLAGDPRHVHRGVVIRARPITQELHGHLPVGQLHRHKAAAGPLEARPGLADERALGFGAPAADDVVGGPPRHMDVLQVVVVAGKVRLHSRGLQQNAIVRVQGLPSLSPLRK